MGNSSPSRGGGHSSIQCKCYRSLLTSPGDVQRFSDLGPGFPPMTQDTRGYRAATRFSLHLASCATAIGRTAGPPIFWLLGKGGRQNARPGDPSAPSHSRSLSSRVVMYTS